MSPRISFNDLIRNNSTQVVKAAEELRKSFFDWYDVKSNMYHEADLKRFRESDFYCQRFIYHRLSQGDEIKGAIDLVKNVFKWRKEYGVNDMKDSDFPEDFVKSQPFFPYRKDKEGNITIMIQASNYFKDSKIKDLRFRYFTYLIEKIDRQFDGHQRITVLGDCQNAGLSNIDLDFSSHAQAVMFRHYPFLVAYSLTYAMPLILTATWNLVKSWMPKGAVNRVVFVDKKTIFDYVDPEDLPESMGGLDKTVYPLEGVNPLNNIPKTLITAIE